MKQIRSTLAQPTLREDDVVICGAVRTPLQRAHKGKFKDLHPEDLLAAALKGLLKKTGVNPQEIQDIIVGTVLTPGGGATAVRMAAFASGFPETTSVMTLNRQCSSGLQAVASIASAIKNGYIDIGIGAGMESMTKHYGDFANMSFSPEIINSCNSASDCLLPMGETTEIVAERFKISRGEQDQFALSSHIKAAKAQREGLFTEEIVPVYSSNGSVIANSDDGIRPNTSLEALGSLKPAFRDNGSATAGNSSQITDGAAAVLIARRSKAKALKLPILARFCSFAVVGVPPSIMGIGPALAIPAALSKASLTLDSIGIFEINEAFASQILYCIKKLGINLNRVNPKGGAIALGHPLGATGARQIATLLPELRRKNQQYGVISMCIGSGMGAAAVLALESSNSKL